MQNCTAVELFLTPRSVSIFYLSFYLPNCPSIYMTVCLTVCLFKRLPAYLSGYLSIYLCNCLSVCLLDCLSDHLSDYLPAYFSVGWPVYLSICLSVCLCDCLAISLSLFDYQSYVQHNISPRIVTYCTAVHSFVIFTNMMLQLPRTYFEIKINTKISY